MKCAGDGVRNITGVEFSYDIAHVRTHGTDAYAETLRGPRS